MLSRRNSLKIIKYKTTWLLRLLLHHEALYEGLSKGIKLWNGINYANFKAYSTPSNKGTTLVWISRRRRVYYFHLDWWPHLQNKNLEKMRNFKIFCNFMNYILLAYSECKKCEKCLELRIFQIFFRNDRNCILRKKDRIFYNPCNFFFTNPGRF